MGPGGQEHNIWGTANEGVIPPGVDVTDGSEITGWIDGVCYGNTLTVVNNFDLYIDGDYWGVPASDNVKDGGWDGDAIMYFLDYNPMAYYLNVSHLTSYFDTSLYEHVDSMFFNRTDQAPGLTTLRMLKINEIVLDPGDGLPQYVYIYDPGQNLGMNNITDYYLQKDDNVTHTTEGEKFDFLTHVNDIVDMGQGYFFINLTSDLELNASDELKLVWRSPYTPNIDPALTGPGNGTDIIVDRVEWGNYTNYISPVTPPDDRDYDNTTLLDFINVTELYGTGASMVRTDDKSSPGYSGNGTDTDDCLADFKVLGQPTSRPEQVTYPVHNLHTGEDFSSIQAAIDDPDTQDGHTIEVAAGTYYENVVVNKTINLTGADRNNTFIDGGNLSNAVSIDGNWVNITGFTITNCGMLDEYAGVKASGGNHTIYGNDIITNNGQGIYLFYSNNTIITNNNVSTNNYNGIYFTASYNNHIIDNIISGNMDTGIQLVGSSCYNDIIRNFVSYNNDHGISLSWGLSSSYNNITDNVIISNNRNGIQVFSSNNNITNNNISVNKNNGIDFGTIPETFYNNVTHNNITGNNWSGIDMSSSLYSNFENNTISHNNYSGISHDGLLTSSYNGIAYNNIAYNNRSGIELAISKDNLIDNNNISNNKNNGIVLGVTGVPSSIRNNITHNSILYNNWSGIHLSSSYSNIDNNTIIGNEGKGLIIGGAFSSSDHNCVRDNNISFNKDKGVHIYGSFSSDSITNLIIYNTLSYNFFGFYLESTTSNNKIYHNNIINNTNQAFDARIFSNQWDNGYPSGGNYWSDYKGVDYYKGPNQDQPGGDGIGDTNYSIDADSIDYYPLMEPYIFKPLENYTILKQGWNLISFPLIQDNQDLVKALEMIDGYYDAVQFFNQTVSSDHWKHHDVGKPFGNDLTHLNETMGFWIHITQPGDTIFLYNGTQPSVNQSITLHPGWNMVGYPSLARRNTTAALNNLIYGTDVDIIWTFDAATQTWQEVGPGDYFELGRGYWVHSTVTKVWDVPL